jgi:hypothetical protein
MNPVYSLLFYFFNIHFSIIIQFTSQSPLRAHVPPMLEFFLGFHDSEEIAAFLVI